MTDGCIAPTGRCECGANRFTVEGQPLLRAVCHCHFCQEYNQASHADILFYRRRQVSLDEDAKVSWRAFKWPPLVRRGSCTNCGKPVVEQMRLPLYPRLTFVPTPNHPAPETLPAPSLHMFYHRRRADADDALPKYSSPLGSELSLMARLTRALLAGRGKR